MITIDNFLHKNCEKEIEEHIFSNLYLPQKKISSRFLYDEKGSKLFKEITQLPEYYLTRTEIPLIKQAASYLKDDLNDVNIIEFGSGDCTKISLLIDSVSMKNRQTICYVPFDVSSSAIQESCDLLLQSYEGLRIHGIVADFMSQLDVIAEKPNKVFCLLGSTIGNFTKSRSEQFLMDLHDIMQSNDRLLLGFDMVKDKEIIERAYNDSKKVTEQFNKNTLNVVNDLVDSDFNPELFDHLAFYNNQHSRIEMHLKALTDQEIRSPRFPKIIHLEKGETIHTENSHKFTTNHIQQLAITAHLDIEKIFSDEKNWFTLALFRKP